MSQFLGQCGASLQSRDVNAALANLRGVGPISFQMGCFTIHTKLPIGMGVTLVAIPQSTPDTVTFSIPFDQIKGDRTGGMAKFIASSLWGTVQSFAEKKIRARLTALGLPADTVTLGQGLDGKTKVGKAVLHLKPLNAWLLRQPPIQGFKVTVDTLWATEDALNLILDVFHTGEGTAPPPRYGLPAGPSYTT
ncbi:hypothetical protein IV102_10545 [bacterium]|nr:hypothetical protein [bacterium]